MNFLDFIKDSVLVIDGATGTMIQALELGDESFGGPDYKMLSDLLSFSRPEAMKEIHKAFFRAGAMAVETNTFGASPMRLSEYNFAGLDLADFAPIPYGIDLRALDYNELAYYFSRRGAEIGCEARAEYQAEADYDGRPLYVLGSIGPSNRVLSSTKADLTVSTYEAIMDNFYHQVCGLLDGGVDVLLYETQQDILELKAAVMGGQKAMAEKGRKAPIMCQVTVDKFGKMQIFHTDIHAALVTLQGIGIDVFGINCSIGPDLMEKTVEKISRYSPLPISVIPNAGLPVSENGKTVFKFSPEDFGALQRRFVLEYGVNIVGGCCGTRPEHIKCVADAVRGLKPKVRHPEPGVFLSGPQQAIKLDGSKTLICIGERLNVRGSQKVREAVENDRGIDHDALEEVVLEQVKELGCEVIDVCMDSNLVDTVAALKEVVHVQTTDFAGAMCIDSFQVDALQEAIKQYPGRPLVNSISMEEASLGVLKVDAVIEATNAHCPCYVGLCTGPKGPGATRSEKLDLASQILDRALERYGVTPDRIFIDVNCFPIGSESGEGLNFSVETLEAIALVKAKYPTVNTTLGVGNLTNGLAKKPYMRKVLTSVFLDEARKRGLDSAIINPNHYVFVSDLDPNDYAMGLRIILERDMDAFADLEEIAEQKQGITTVRRTSYDDLPLEQAICEKIKDGHKERVPGSFAFRGHTYAYADRIALQVAEAMEKHQPLDFINVHLMGAMQELGDGFGRGEVSLPHLLKSADVMRQAMGFLEEFMRVEAGVDLHAQIAYKGTVVIGTVYQDVHSIGKDLARTLLENYGYRVIDLGTMTPLQSYIDTAKEYQADAIGMSALLVQTSNHMITVSQMMQEQDLDIPVLIGGAPVSDRHAGYVAMAGRASVEEMRDDVFYCRTAMDGVNVMNKLMSKGNISEFRGQNKAKIARRLERANQKAAEEALLLKTLPRRAVSHDHFVLNGIAYFAQRRIAYTLREFAAHLDRKTLYSLNWRFGGAAVREKQGHGAAQLDALFEQWVTRATEQAWILPQGVMGIYPCQSDGDGVILYSPEDRKSEIARIPFTTVIGGEKSDLVNGAQYFHPVSSGILSAVGIQLTTSGPQVDTVLAELKAAGDSESNLFLQGLSDRVAEDMAEHLHQEQRKLLGLDAKAGQRWSPGYPGMRDIHVNALIHKLLDGAGQLGVQLTDASEFSPTGTTGAIVSFHPDARYM
ncbi:MAG: homocysteine S-methyltransferase family protein [Candidatus Hydrogenedentes bacterium]|nr:homocysteine S-methyltransferase family protein [Candidatus Hydrogenedentota bacterium]